MENITEKFQIALVDDDPVILKLLARILRSEEHVIHTATDGQEGWDLVQRVSPDVAILDVMMPKMDGYELCKKIKHYTKSFGTYVILLTAKSSEQDVIEGFHCGADDYLSKPFSKEELLLRLQAGLRQHRVRRELVNMEKTTGMGSVVGGLCHHFNNLLGGVRGYLELAHMRIDKDKAFVDSAILSSIHNLDSAALIVRNLSHYAGKAYLQRIEQVKLDEILRMVVAQAESQLKENSISIELSIEESFSVEVDPEAIRDVFANIVSNGIQAITMGKGSLEIRMFEKDKQVVVEVSDDGVGIAAEDIPYLFDPFFSTKTCQPVVSNRGHGMIGKDVPGHGLGLSVVQGIVHAHGGRVQVESKIKIGTTIRIMFPLAM